jgi:lipoyl(octanoyl) transferase
MTDINFIDIGVEDYSVALERQQKLFNLAVSSKVDDGEKQKNILLFVEHPHVYTLGKSGDQNNLLLSSPLLKSKNIAFEKTDRGGDITYHGPGQIVGYPIFDLQSFDIGLREYIHRLEEAVIITLSHYNITGMRDDDAAGVWLEKASGVKHKICAIGVRCSRYITMHGFALNVNTDLNYFNYINPCGFTDRGVTSIQQELGEEIDTEEVKRILRKAIKSVF